MPTNIVIGVLIYLLIGVAILSYSVKKDKYGGFILEFAIPLILFYPFFIVTSLFRR